MLISQRFAQGLVTTVQAYGRQWVYSLEAGLALLGAYYMIRRAQTRWYYSSPGVLPISLPTQSWESAGTSGIMHPWCQGLSRARVGGGPAGGCVIRTEHDFAETNYAHTAGIGDSVAPVSWAGARRFAAGAATIPAGHLLGGGERLWAPPQTPGWARWKLGLSAIARNIP